MQVQDSVPTTEKTKLEQEYHQCKSKIVFPQQRKRKTTLAPNKGLPQQAPAPPEATVVASQQKKSRAKYRASKQPNVTLYGERESFLSLTPYEADSIAITLYFLFSVPTPMSSAEQVSFKKGSCTSYNKSTSCLHQTRGSFVEALPYMQFVVHPVVYLLLTWNSAATMETTIKKIKPYAPEPSSSATHVSAQTSATHVSAQTVSQITQMKTTISWPREDLAYSPLLNKRKITPAESTGICNLPSTLSADKITLGEQEAIPA
ncbi:hypothetical protein DITRI_Ditri11bG0063800 [Diplodiscus trichospermus]